MMWKLLSRQEALATDYIRVTEDRVQTSSGFVIDKFFTVHERDFAVAIAICDDGKLITVDQYRYPANVISIEFPGGIVGADEDPISAAKRELLEESGYSGSEWSSIGSFFVNPGRNTNQVHVFLLKNAKRVSLPSLDDGEQIQNSYRTTGEFHRAVAAGQVVNGIHLAAFGIAQSAIAFTSDA